MQASVIVPAHNRRADLAELLPALLQETGAWPGVEVLLIDDASTDGTAEFVLRNETSLGPAASRNRASRAAKGSLLLYLDSDGVPAPGWLKAMLHADDGATVLLGCPVDYATGAVQGTPRRATFLGKSLPCKAEAANTGPGCNLGVPRRIFEATGGFDESIPYYFEDSDLCIRARRAGARFRYVPEAVFRHKGSRYRVGDAIRMQEDNSSFAMLRLYRGSPIRLAAFFLGNAAWLVVRLLLWSLRFRFADAALLWRGWVGGHRRFLQWMRKGNE